MSQSSASLPSVPAAANGGSSGALSLYLHIPFCRSKCTYCAFNTYTRLEHLIGAFVEAMQSELRHCAGGARKRQVHTVFFGGGTPSLLQPEQLAGLLDAILGNYRVSDDVEVSLEANPNDLNQAWLTAARDAGVNRLSIGVQSTHARDLRLFARRHDNDQVAQSVVEARRAGFGQINLDLIYGIPEQDLADWEQTLRQTLALQPDHLSLYALSLEADTPLQEWVAQGRVTAPDEDGAAEQYDRASAILADAGYRQYEISNWALAGSECRHNLQYWRNLEWLGLGPGAHGRAAGMRTKACLSPQRYISALGEDAEARPWPATPATEDLIRLDREDDICETLIMGLRLTREGIDRAQFARRFGEDLLDIHGDALLAHAGDGLLEITPERVRLSRAGRLLSNRVMRDLV